MIEVYWWCMVKDGSSAAINSDLRTTSRSKAIAKVLSHLIDVHLNLLMPEID